MIEVERSSSRLLQRSVPKIFREQWKELFREHGKDLSIETSIIHFDRERRAMHVQCIVPERPTHIQAQNLAEAVSQKTGWLTVAEFLFCPGDHVERFKKLRSEGSTIHGVSNIKGSLCLYYPTQLNNFSTSVHADVTDSSSYHLIGKISPIVAIGGRKSEELMDLSKIDSVSSLYYSVPVDVPPPFIVSRENCFEVEPQTVESVLEDWAKAMRTASGRSIALRNPPSRLTTKKSHLPKRRVPTSKYYPHYFGLRFYPHPHSEGKSWRTPSHRPPRDDRGWASNRNRLKRAVDWYFEGHGPFVEVFMTKGLEKQFSKVGLTVDGASTLRQRFSFTPSYTEVHGQVEYGYIWPDSQVPKAITIIPSEDGSSIGYALNASQAIHPYDPILKQKGISLKNDSEIIATIKLQDREVGVSSDLLQRFIRLSHLSPDTHKAFKRYGASLRTGICELADELCKESSNWAFGYSKDKSQIETCVPRISILG